MRLSSHEQVGFFQHVDVPPVDEFAAPVYRTIHQLLFMTKRIEKLCEAAETAVGSLPPLDEIILLASRTMEPMPRILEEGTDVR